MDAFINLFGSGSLLHLHKLQQIRCVRMLEKQATWMREGRFDRNEAVAERPERTMRHLSASYDPEPFHIGVQYNTRWPPSPEEFTVSIKEVNGLRLELLLSQPPPPSPQLLPRRLLA